MSIPKVIHYCWFGDNEKSELIQKCIKSWREFAPTFEIVEWNEINFDVNKYSYAKEAYQEKKYAFVSDVARFDILYTYGGVYLDTDVELIKPIETFLMHDVFMGFDQRNLVASGLIFGSIKEHYLIDEFLKYYRNHNFLLKNGNSNTTTVVTIVSDILKKDQFMLAGDYVEKNRICIYPYEYFDPFDYESKVMRSTENTYSIHYYSMTWKNKIDIHIYKLGSIIKKIIGQKKYDKLARFKHKHFG